MRINSVNLVQNFPKIQRRDATATLVSGGFDWTGLFEVKSRGGVSAFAQANLLFNLLDY